MLKQLKNDHAETFNTGICYWYSSHT